MTFFRISFHMVVSTPIKKIFSNSLKLRNYRWYILCTGIGNSVNSVLWKQIYYLCLLLTLVSIWWEPDQSWSVYLNLRFYIQLYYLCSSRTNDSVREWNRSFLQFFSIDIDMSLFSEKNKNIFTVNVFYFTKTSKERPSLKLLELKWNLSKRLKEEGS